MSDQSQIERVRDAMKIVASLASEDPIYEPIYEAFERDLAALKGASTTQSRMKRTLEIADLA